MTDAMAGAEETRWVSEFEPPPGVVDAVWADEASVEVSFDPEEPAEKAGAIFHTRGHYKCLVLQNNITNDNVELS